MAVSKTYYVIQCRNNRTDSWVSVYMHGYIDEQGFGSKSEAMQCIDGFDVDRWRVVRRKIKEKVVHPKKVVQVRHYSVR